MRGGFRARSWCASRSSHPVALVEAPGGLRAVDERGTPLAARSEPRRRSMLPIVTAAPRDTALYRSPRRDAREAPALFARAAARCTRAGATTRSCYRSPTLAGASDDRRDARTRLRRYRSRRSRPRAAPAARRRARSPLPRPSDRQTANEPRTPRRRARHRLGQDHRHHRRSRRRPAASIPSIKVLGVGQARTTGHAPRRRRATSRRRRARSGRRCRTPSAWRARTIDRRVRRHRRRARAGDDVARASSPSAATRSRKSDVDRANEVARAQAIPQDRELLHAIPQEYTVDKDTGIRDPIGMSRHAARDGDVPRDDRQLAGDRTCARRWSARATRCASSCSSRSRARSPCSPRTRRSSASRSSRWARARPTSPSSTRGRSATSATIAFGGNNVTSDIVHGLGRHAGGRGAAEGALRLRVRAAGRSDRRDPAAEHRGAGRPADSARAAGAHHPPAHGRDLRPRAARHRDARATPGKLSGGHRAHRRRRGDAGDRRAGERRVRHRRARRHAVGEHRRAERLGRGAALRDGGRARAVRRAAASALGRRRGVGEADVELPSSGGDGQARRSESRSGCRISSEPRCHAERQRRIRDCARSCDAVKHPSPSSRQS